LGGGDETISEEAQPEAQAEQLEESIHKNLVENIDSRTALPAEGETGAAPSAGTVEPEDDRAGATKENIEPVTIESSSEWEGGTLIMEEQPEEQENIP